MHKHGEGVDWSYRLRVSAGWIVTILVVFVLPIGLWVARPEVIGETTTFRGLLIIIAKVTAFTAVTSYAWSLLLGARLKFFDWLFFGLDKVYVAHHIIGMYSFLAATGHALTITAAIGMRSLPSALKLWSPGVNTTVTWGVVAMFGFALLLLATVYKKMKHQTFIVLHRLLGLFFVPAVIHTFMASGHLAENPELRRYMLVLSILGVLAYLYHSVFGMLLVRRYPYRVVEVRALDDTVTELELKPRLRPLVFVPGQFAYISIKDPHVDDEAHPFSITASPREQNLKFAVKHLGDYTGNLPLVQVGSRASIEGPFGKFSYKYIHNKRQIWIAGGVGIAPFVSMARSLRRNSPLEIDLYYCTKTADEAVFLLELDEIASWQPNFNVKHVCESRDGFLTIDTIAKESGGLEGKDLFLCGPPGMMAAMQGQLEQHEVPDERVHFERFSY